MEIVSGKNIADQIKAIWKEKNEQDGIKPVMATLVFGNDTESMHYIKLKDKAVQAIGGENRKIILEPDITKEQLLYRIQELNKDKEIDGILLQLPLSEQLQEFQEEMLAAIDPAKDVDGFNPINRGRLTGDKPGFISCAALACMEVIERTISALEGRRAVLIGDSFDVIIPLAIILVRHGCNVIILSEYKPTDIAGCDILVVEKGSAQMVKGEHLPAGVLVIDAGFYWEDGKVCGNVDSESVANIEGSILPVPGGMGPLLIAKLVENLSVAARLNRS